MIENIERTAVISTCGLYRYALTRRWASGPLMQWVMLNPSTADANFDDPTIRRCMAFARRDHWAGICVRNRFALRSTDPKQLALVTDPVGPNNQQHLSEIDGPVHCGWGDKAPTAWRNYALNSTFASKQLYVLGLTKHRQPKHPLYIKGDTMWQRVDSQDLLWR